MNPTQVAIIKCLEKSPKGMTLDGIVLSTPTSMSRGFIRSNLVLLIKDKKVSRINAAAGDTLCIYKLVELTKPIQDNQEVLEKLTTLAYIANAGKAVADYCIRTGEKPEDCMEIVLAMSKKYIKQGVSF
jgi:hypothetical protein